MGNIILNLITIFMIIILCIEIYFIFIFIKNQKIKKEFEKELENNPELMRKVRKQNEEFWEKRKFLNFYYNSYM